MPDVSVTKGQWQLPDDFHMARIPCRLRGFGYREIAGIMQYPLGTVMSRLHWGGAGCASFSLKRAGEAGMAKGERV